MKTLHKVTSVVLKGLKESNLQTFFKGALGAWPSTPAGDGVINGTVFWSFVGVSEDSIPKLK